MAWRLRAASCAGRGVAAQGRARAALMHILSYTSIHSAKVTLSMKMINYQHSSYAHSSRDTERLGIPSRAAGVEFPGRKGCCSAASGGGRLYTVQLYCTQGRQPHCSITSLAQDKPGECWKGRQEAFKCIQSLKGHPQLFDFSIVGVRESMGMGVEHINIYWNHFRHIKGTLYS